MVDRIRPEEIRRIIAGSDRHPPEDKGNRLDVPLSSGLPTGRREEPELRRPLLSPGDAGAYDGQRLDRSFEPLRGEPLQAGGEAPSRRRLLFPSIVVLLALAGFASVLLYGMNADGPRQGMLEPPTLKAQIDVDKIKPDEPGGLQVPNRDVQVLDQTDTGSMPEVVLMPVAEEPVPLPEPRKAGPLDVLPERSPVSVTENDAAVHPGKLGVPVLGVPALGVPRRPTAKLQGREDEVLAELRAARDGQLARQQTAAAAPVAASPPTAAGPYLIQLASMKTAEAADEAWGRISRSYSAQLAGLAHSIQPAEISGSGFRFRVRAGSFPTRAAAQTRCDRLKAAGQACIVVTP
ncbi:MAG: SPOR domain-containing protein [Rhodospirillales bacterium]|nr:SPOR domain-containing protein [Rhodospirillales bacterium]